MKLALSTWQGPKNYIDISKCQDSNVWQQTAKKLKWQMLILMLWFTLKTSGLKFRLWKMLKQRECGDAHCHFNVFHLNLFVFNCYGSTFYLSNPSYKSIHGTNQNCSMRLKLQQGLNWKPDKTVHRFQVWIANPNKSFTITLFYTVFIALFMQYALRKLH